MNRRNEFLEFDDEKTMLEALDLNDTVSETSMISHFTKMRKTTLNLFFLFQAFQNRKEYLSYLRNYSTGKKKIIHNIYVHVCRSNTYCPLLASMIKYPLMIKKIP